MREGCVGDLQLLVRKHGMLLVRNEAMEVQQKITMKGLWQVLKQAGKNFKGHKVPKLSASLAYYTIFSFGPMMIVVIYVAGLVWGKQGVEGAIMDQLKGFVGDQSARQIQQIIANAAISGSDKIAAIIGSTVLLMSATTVFAEIQDTINMIWQLRVTKGRGWVKMLLTRLLSFAIIVTLGFLLLVSLLINVLIEGLMNRLQEYFSYDSVVVVYIANLLFTFFVISLLFAAIFKVLPDAVIRWKDVAAGAIFTAALFMIGKFLITFYIGKTDIGGSYGAAGSLVILLLWVYYSSIILYFGAEFTKVYATKFGCEIRPNDYAVTIQTIQVESRKKSVQENESDAEVVKAEIERSNRIKTDSSTNSN